MHSITWHDWFKDPPTVFNAALLLFTVLLASIGAFQVHISRSTSRRQLRAYMFVDSYNLGDGSTQVPPVEDRLSTPWAFIAIKNSGQTPAYKVRHVAQIDVRRTDEEGNITAPVMKGHYAPAFASPGGGLTKFLWLDRAISTQEIDEIRKGERSVFVFSQIEYYDAFKKKQSLTYKLRYNGVFPPAGFPSLTFCSTGNEAT